MKVAAILGERRAVVNAVYDGPLARAALEQKPKSANRVKFEALKFNRGPLSSTASSWEAAASLPGAPDEMMLGDDHLRAQQQGQLGPT